jgi:NH3-dependent NAD+ synthetase
VIARNILTKPPSAELRENQKDQDSLPPYDVLDAILEGLVEKEMRVADVVARGHDLETVKKIERLLYLAEYKRPVRPGRQGDAEEFWPRPALSDHQLVSRSRRGRDAA